MPLVGPTPADWANSQANRRDDQMRTMMQMAMAAKQMQEDQRRYEQQSQRQGMQDFLDVRRTAAYEQSVMGQQQPQPTDLMRNYEYLQGQYPGQDVGPMVLPNLKQGAGENYSFDVDDWTAADMEKRMGMAPGTVRNMHPRQRNLANQQYLDIAHPKPSTSQTPEHSTAYGRQKAAIQDTLNDLEARRTATISNMNSLSGKDLPVPDDAKKGIRELDARISKVRNFRDVLAVRELTNEEYAEYMRISAGGGGLGVSDLAYEIAEEMGVQPDVAQSFLNQVLKSGDSASGRQGRRE